MRCLSPEIEYHNSIKLLRGVTAKLFFNYDLAGDDYYSKFDHRTQKAILLYRRILWKSNLYLSSLRKNRNPTNAKLQILYSNILVMEHLANHLDVSSQFKKSILFLIKSYILLFSKMLRHNNLDYKSIFNQISQNLILSVLWHEYFLNSSSSLNNHILRAALTFSVLLNRHA